MSDDNRGENNNNIEFNVYKIRGIIRGYYAQTKFSNNQTGIIFFTKDRLKNCTEFTVAFGISNKKKYIKQWLLGKKDMESYITGNCGIEGLVWAKNALLQFEECISKIYRHSRIVVIASDSRRKRIYRHYLEREGYKFCRYYGYEALIKNIKGEEKCLQ